MEGGGDDGVFVFRGGGGGHDRVAKSCITLIRGNGCASDSDWEHQGNMRWPRERPVGNDLSELHSCSSIGSTELVQAPPQLLHHLNQSTLRFLLVVIVVLGANRCCFALR